MDEIIEENYQERNERPPFLIVLLVISGLYMGYSLITTLPSLFQDKPVIDKEQAMDAFYEQIDGVADQEGGEQAVEMVENIMNHLFYLTDDAYYSNLLLNLVCLIIGIVSLVFMFRLKKLGYHLYLIYSIISAFGVYIIVPNEFVSGLLVFFGIILSLIMVGLYTVNLKHLK